MRNKFLPKKTEIEIEFENTQDHWHLFDMCFLHTIHYLSVPGQKPLIKTPSAK